MVFIELLEAILIFLVFTFFVFQIIVPMWNGTVLFPNFRFKARKLERQLRQARLDVELAQDQNTLRKIEETKGES